MEKLTKIVATVGPSSDNEKTIRDLIQQGVNVFRLNFSHGAPEWHIATTRLIREVSKDFDQGIAILQDLSGPKIRTGDFTGGVAELIIGNQFILTKNLAVGNNDTVSVNYPQVIDQSEVGQIIKLDDGRLTLEVIQKSDDSLKTIIIDGGIIKSRRGINVPGLSLDIEVFTDKDQSDIHVLADNDANPDWISLSFVQSADNILKLKKFLNNKSSQALVMAKIETAEAIKNIHEIIQVSDGIMVARGDLATETPLAHVPLHQHEIVIACRQAGKPVIVATQMLESMINSPVPTRAEVADIASAIMDGTDAIMLSGETATGNYPVNAVSTMTNVSTVIEDSNIYTKRVYLETTCSSTVQSAAASLVAFANSQSATAIVVVTQSGAMAQAVARLRPGLPIIAITTSKLVWRRLALSHGVWARYVDDLPDNDLDFRSWLPSYLVGKTYLEIDDNVLVSFGQNIHESGSTDTITSITL